MKLIVNVTQNNIDEARPSTKCSCPIAHAVVEAFKAESIGNEYAHASVDHDKGRFHESGGAAHSHRFSLPDAAQKFIASRDRRETVRPFSFSIIVESK